MFDGPLGRIGQRLRFTCCASETKTVTLDTQKPDEPESAMQVL